ncbi:MAG: helix-turn-helix transcriptional regulator [Steroidobacteraceae bacterium]
MSDTASTADKPARAPKRLRDSGTRVIYPRGLEIRYGISLSTRWRWERDGLLPARDVYIGGKAVGWRPETIDTSDRGQSA